MIEICEVTKKYGDFTAIDKISFKVENSSIVGLAGYNGAGKTTLLRVVAGVFRAQEGKVLLDGADAYDNDKERKDLFYLADDMWYAMSATGKSAAKYYSTYYPNFDMDVFLNICKIFGIDEKKRIRALSKGMTKQISIAIAFASKPKYLLIDETFDGLDPQKKVLLKKIMAEYIQETKASVIITSHDLAEISSICDYVILLNGKRVQLSCPIGEVSKNFRRVTASFKEDVTKNLFEGINYRSLKMDGKQAVIVVYGTIENELKKLEEKGGTIKKAEELTLEEVFMEQLEENEEEVANLFSKNKKKGTA
ncbi:MAG: ABC transporter ATP-binding protein [Clostridia bacterium]|nr:ABC transporter ATP-binding protein [Clostridia bacterium]